MHLSDFCAIYSVSIHDCGLNRCIYCIPLAGISKIKSNNHINNDDAMHRQGHTTPNTIVVPTSNQKWFSLNEHKAQIAITMVPAWETMPKLCHHWSAEPQRLSPIIYPFLRTVKYMGHGKGIAKRKTPHQEEEGTIRGWKKKPRQNLSSNRPWLKRLKFWIRP